MVSNLRLEGWQPLHQQLRGIAKRRAALDAEEARCVREAHALRLWRRFGYVHMAEYLERELGYGPQVAAERLRVARELGELPKTEASLADGTLSYSAVRELSRIATADTEDEWLTEARGKNLRQIEAMVSGRKRGDRPCDPTDAKLVSRVVRLELLPEVFALFRQTQSALADDHGDRLDDNAFVEALCRRALEGSGTSERPAHQIAITVCESCKRGWQNGAGREIEVGPEVIERASCDAELIGSLDATQPARVTATVTPRIRRQVLARDHHRCTVDGCRSARNLDLHHIEYQRDGGKHELSNMTTVCSGHHAQLHDGALMIRGKAPDALECTWRELEVPHGETVGRTAETRNDDQRGMAAMPNSDRSEPDPTVRNASTQRTVGEEDALAMRAATISHVEDRCAADPSARDAHGPLTTAADGTLGLSGGRAAPLRRAEGCIASVTLAQGASNVRVRGMPTTSEDQAHETPLDPATACPHVENRCVPGHVVRDARDALTTAGYKLHEARAAVERALTQLDDPVTLPQLIRQALRCCVIAHR